MAIQSINPATDEVLDTFPETSPEELERTLADGHAAFVDLACAALRGAVGADARGRPASSASGRTRSPAR